MKKYPVLQRGKWDESGEFKSRPRPKAISETLYKEWKNFIGIWEWGASENQNQHSDIIIISRTQNGNFLSRIYDSGLDKAGRPHTLGIDSIYLEAGDDQLQTMALIAGNSDLWKNISHEENDFILTIPDSEQTEINSTLLEEISSFLSHPEKGSFFAIGDTSKFVNPPSNICMSKISVAAENKLIPNKEPVCTKETQERNENVNTETLPEKTAKYHCRKLPFICLIIGIVIGFIPGAVLQYNSTVKIEQVKESYQDKIDECNAKLEILQNEKGLDKKNEKLLADLIRLHNEMERSIEIYKAETKGTK